MLSPTLGTISERFFSPSQRKISRSANRDYSLLMLAAAEAFTGSSGHQTDFSLLVHSPSFGALWDVVSFTVGTEVLLIISSAGYENTGCTFEWVLLRGQPSFGRAPSSPGPGGSTSPAVPHTPGRKGALAAPEQFHCEMKGCTGHIYPAEVILR